MSEILLIIVILFVGGRFFGALASMVITLAGTPGSLLWTEGRRRENSALMILGVVFSSIVQAYLGLSFTAIYIQFTWVFAGLTNIIIWPLAFAACTAPAYMALKGFYTERQDREDYLNGLCTAYAWQFTLLATTIGFILFAIFPSLLHPLWTWVVSTFHFYPSR
jgi:hypothetical protein